MTSGLSWKMGSVGANFMRRKPYWKGVHSKYAVLQRLTKSALMGAVTFRQSNNDWWSFKVENSGDYNNMK